MGNVTALRFVGLDQFAQCLDGARMTMDGFDANGDLVVDAANDSATVAAIQRALKDLGYPVTVSGTYDGPTADQVRRFKIDQTLALPAGMVAHDGVTGRGTSGRLNELFTIDLSSIVPVVPPTDPPTQAPLEKQVRDHISRALSACTAGSEYDRLWCAAWMLKNDRNAKVGGVPINCGNKPLAYAEHYMLARAFVASGAFVPSELLPVGRLSLYLVAQTLIGTYDLGKLTNAIVAALPSVLGGATDSIRTKLAGLVYQLGDCPMSDAPPDITSTAWGLHGAGDGLVQL